MVKRSFAVIIIALLCAGCGRISRGLLYTDQIRPLCVDFRGTGLGERTSSGATKVIDLPLTRVDLSLHWDSRAIGDIARAHGIETVYGCDLRTESYLLGLWRRDEVLVYGD
jgi:hypothetical protein